MKDTLGRENRRLADRQCPHCGTTFRPIKESSRYCSRPCMWANNGRGNRKPESWWINPRGYVEGRVDAEDGQKRRVKGHRFVVENSIGRPLQAGEDVHHIDGNKQNNDVANLAVLAHAEHTRLTNAERTYKKGYRLDLSEDERRRRSDRMRKMHAAARAERREP